MIKENLLQSLYSAESWSKSLFQVESFILKERMVIYIFGGEINKTLIEILSGYHQFKHDFIIIKSFYPSSGCRYYIDIFFQFLALGIMVRSYAGPSSINHTSYFEGIQLHTCQPYRFTRQYAVVYRIFKSSTAYRFQMFSYRFKKKKCKNNYRELFICRLFLQISTTYKQIQIILALSVIVSLLICTGNFHWSILYH